jgi:hypothetical protein
VGIINVEFVGIINVKCQKKSDETNQNTMKRSLANSIGKPKGSNPSNDVASSLEVFSDDAAGKKKKNDKTAAVDRHADAQFNQVVIVVKPRRRVSFHDKLPRRYDPESPVSETFSGVVCSNEAKTPVLVRAHRDTCRVVVNVLKIVIELQIMVHLLQVEVHFVQFLCH